MAESSSKRRSFAFSPLASLILGGLVLADVLTLPHGSIAGEFMHELLDPEHTRCHTPRPPTAYLLREGGVLQLAAYDDPRAHAYRSGAGDPEVHRAVLTCDPEITDSGFWAITKTTFDHTMRIKRRSDEALPEDEQRQARAMYAPFAIDGGISPEMGEFMARGDGRVEITRWDGYLRNLGSLLVGSGFLLSFRWLFR